LRAAELNQCLAACFSGREPPPNVFFHGELQMNGHFRIQFTVLLRAAEK
jgi:hypothetical protein